MRLPPKVNCALLGFLATLNLLLRYPQTPHETGIDSFFIHTLAVGISNDGRASWIFSNTRENRFSPNTEYPCPRENEQSRRRRRARRPRNSAFPWSSRRRIRQLRRLSPSVSKDQQMRKARRPSCGSRSVVCPHQLSATRRTHLPGPGSGVS